MERQRERKNMSTKPKQSDSRQQDKARKLQINKETIKDLSAREPQKVKGGLAYPDESKGCSK
jgi:hypothetical protein